MFSLVELQWIWHLAFDDIFLQRFVLKNGLNPSESMYETWDLLIEIFSLNAPGNIAANKSGKSSQALNVKPAAATFMAHSISAVITWSFCGLVSRGISFEDPATTSPPPCDVAGLSFETLKTNWVLHVLIFILAMFSCFWPSAWCNICATPFLPHWIVFST